MNKKIPFVLLFLLVLFGFGCSYSLGNKKSETVEPQVQAEAEFQSETAGDQVVVETPIDTDNDGLTDVDETGKYKTDPLKADTDGDGYSDGDEVKNGYNPNEAAKSQITTKTETIHEQDSQTKDGLTVNTDITAKFTTDCGSETFCFYDKFSVCEPAVMTGSIGFVDMYYEIIGPVTGGCNIVFIFTKNPNPAWENQPGYCVLDNSKDFTAAFQAAWDANICTGPFADVFKN